MQFFPFPINNEHTKYFLAELTEASAVRHLGGMLRIYTLAEFTAKHMPRNKRSVSGLCQGPKYFSFNGTSLYQMKNSFLGRNK